VNRIGVVTWQNVVFGTNGFIKEDKEELQPSTPLPRVFVFLNAVLGRVRSTPVERRLCRQLTDMDGIETRALIQRSVDRPQMSHQTSV